MDRLDTGEIIGHTTSGSRVDRVVDWIGSSKRINQFVESLVDGVDHPNMIVRNAASAAIIGIALVGSAFADTQDINREY